MQALIEATLLLPKVKVGAMTRSEYKSEKARLLPILAQMDAAHSAGRRQSRGNVAAGGGVAYHRPMVYVPAFNHKGSLQIPAQYNVGRQISNSFGTYRVEGKTKGALMMLFGVKHCAVIGWVTRDRIIKTSNTGRRYFAGYNYSAPLRMRAPVVRKKKVSTGRPCGAGKYGIKVAGACAIGGRQAVGLGKSKCVGGARGVKVGGLGAPGSSSLMEA